MRVLFASFCPWGLGQQVGSHHYARLFQEDGHRVFWLSHPLNYYRFVRRSDEDQNLIQAWRRGLYVSEDGICSLTPLALIPYLNAPLLRNAWLGRRTLKWTAPSIGKTLERNGFASPELIWFGRPRMLSLLRCLTGDRPIVYRMADLNTSFQGCPKSMEELEAELCRRSTVVFATAHSLVERAGRWAERVVYLPNGVDAERFQITDAPEPDDMATIPHPRIIFVGTISDWFDSDAVEFLARQKPGGHIILIGPIAGVGSGFRKLRARIQFLSELPNVHYLGFRPPEAMPCYLAHADVGLIPFTAIPLTHAASPIKLLEYAAASLPVVCRDLTESRLQGGPTLFYDTPGQCLEMVDEAILQHVSLGKQMRALAWENRWASRYRTVQNVLSDCGLQDIGDLRNANRD